VKIALTLPLIIAVLQMAGSVAAASSEVIHLESPPELHALPEKSLVPEAMVGTYCVNWEVGLMAVGWNGGVGFVLDHSGKWERTRPIVFWVDPKSGQYLQVESIESINHVLEANFSGEGVPAQQVVRWERSENYFRHQIDLVRNCIHERVVHDGPTGFPMDSDNDGLFKNNVRHWRALGLDSKTADLLVRLGGEKSVALDLKAHSWSATWCQVTAGGAIERVTLRGVLPAMGDRPVARAIKLKSVTREEIFEGGTVKPDMLRANKLFGWQVGLPE
jgi:hypothetical protein